MTRRYPSKEAADLIAWARQFGWQPGERDSAGHLVMHHPSGVSLGISMTPSEFRTVANTKAQMLRLTGDREDKPRAARYRHQRQRGRFVDTKPAPVPAQVKEAYEEIAEVDQQILQCHPRRHAQKLVDLAARRLEAEETLRRYYQPVPPHPTH